MEKLDQLSQLVENGFAKSMILLNKMIEDITATQVSEDQRAAIYKEGLITLREIVAPLMKCLEQVSASQAGVATAGVRATNKTRQVLYLALAAIGGGTFTELFPKLVSLVFGS